MALCRGGWEVGGCEIGFFLFFSPLFLSLLFNPLIFFFFFFFFQVECNVSEVHVDQTNKLVTAPAYMYDAAPHEAYDSAEKMVDAVLSLVNE